MSVAFAMMVTMMDDITSYSVQIRSVHPYGFRSGEWAIIRRTIWMNYRPCFEIEFLDRKRDYWPVIDASDEREFRPGPEREDNWGTMGGGEDATQHEWQTGHPWVGTIEICWRCQ